MDLLQRLIPAKVVEEGKLEPSVRERFQRMVEGMQEADVKVIDGYKCVGLVYMPTSKKKKKITGKEAWVVMKEYVESMIPGERTKFEEVPWAYIHKQKGNLTYLIIGARCRILDSTHDYRMEIRQRR